MVDIETVRNMAMALPGTEERDHFGLPSFRVKNKIFSTLWVKENKMMVKLSLIDQSMFSAIDRDVIYPVPNKYGALGYTYFELAFISPEILQDALTSAWRNIDLKKKSK